MIKQYWRWILAALFLYLVLLIAYLPAAQVAYRLPLPNTVKLGKVSGTLWQGNIDRVVVNNMPIQQVNWTLSALPLFMGALSVDLDAGNMRSANAIAFKGPLEVDLLSEGNLTASDFLLYLPVDLVLAEVQLPLPVDAGGRFRVNVESLTLEAGICSQMMAYGDWLNASVAGTQGPIELGNFSATLRCDNKQYIISVAEPNAFGLTLDAQAATDFSTFTATSKFKPDPSLPQEVHDAAQFFGQPDSQGYIHYDIR